MGWHDKHRFAMQASFICCFWLLVAGGSLMPLSLVAGQPPSTLCIVVGAPGEPEYGEMFQQWSGNWLKSSGMTTSVLIGGGISKTDREEQKLSDKDQLRQWIISVEGIEQPGTYWLVLIGHGTYDGKTAKFNMRGADVSSSELGEWIIGSKHRWVIAVCASSSGPFLTALAKPGRVIVAATKSGSENNLSRFGGYLSQCIGDISSDLDHDGLVSVLEAFLSASRKTELYYEEKKLLATEHAILDDNGDGKGTGTEFYRGLRPIKRSEKGAVDGELARRVWLIESNGAIQLGEEKKIRVSEIEKQIDALREKKATMAEDVYYVELEKLLLELARILYPSSE